jgi:hypothetical protein
MKRSSGWLVLLMASLLFLGFAECLWAETIYVIQGIVRRADNGEKVNGAQIWINCTYQGETSYIENGNFCGTPYTGDGAYRFTDGPGLNLCTSNNEMKVSKIIGGVRYHATISNVRIYDGTCTPCTLQDVYISSSGSWNGCESR